MRNYIVFDGYRYTAAWRAWNPAEGEVPSTGRVMIDGTLDVTYGNATVLRWQGEIRAPVVAEAGEYGTIANLRTSLRKRQLLTFEDHYGTSYTVHSKGPNKERSNSAMWDGDSNIINVVVQLTAVA